MIRVTIELLPFGSEENKRTIGTIEIVNDGSGSKTVGNYKYSLSKNAPIAKTPGIWKKGEIKNFPRQSKGPYDLLYRVLQDAVASRNV